MVVSRLGFEVDSSQAARAAIDLDKMVDASQRAEKGAQGVGRASREMSASMQAITTILRDIERHTSVMAAGMAKGGAAVEALGNISGTATGRLNAMRATSVTLSADLSEMASTASAAARATDQLAQEMTESSVAAQRQEAAIDGVAAAQGRAAATASATATATRAVAMSAGMAQMQSRQLAFQLIDMGQAIPLAFQSPIYALQNMGFQIAQIGQLYMGQGGMRAALTDSISMVSRFAARLGPAALAVGAIGGALAGLTYEINRASDVTVGFGDTALATWQVISGGIYSILQPAISAITPWFAEEWDTFIDDVTASGNQIIGAFVGAYRYVMSIWRNLPEALSGLAKQAANSVMEVFSEDLLTFNGQTLIPGLDMSGRRFNLTDSEQSAIRGAEGEFGDATSRNYMGELFDTISGRAVQNALKPTSDELKEMEKAAAAAQREAERLAKSYDRIVLGAQQFIAGQETARTALGLSEEAAARLRYEQDLLNQAQRAGIELTPEQSAQLQQLASDMAAAEVETSAMREAMDSAKETSRSFMEDLRSGMERGASVWESFANAAINALDRITDKLLNDVLDAIFEVNSAGAGGGGIGGFLSGLLGIGGSPGNVSAMGTLFANGGVLQSGNVIPFANGGIVSRPTIFPMANGAGLMGEAGPEAIMPLKRGPGGRLGVEMHGTGGVTVQMAPITIDARGADPAGLARVEQKVEQLRREMPIMAVEAVREADSRRTA